MANVDYLNKTGLNYYHSKVKTMIEDAKGVTAVTPTSGTVETEIVIPTKTSDLYNDSGFVTRTQVEQMIAEAIEEALEASY